MIILNCIISLLLFSIILRQEVNLHNKRLNNGVAIKHKEEWLIRAVLLLPSVILLSLPYYNKHDFNTFWLTATTAAKILISGGFLAVLWWELFDGFYNLKRKKPWSFIGTIEKDESFFDNILRRFSTKGQRILKIGLISLFLVLLVLSKILL